MELRKIAIFVDDVLSEGGPGYARCIHCERELYWRLFREALRVQGMSAIVSRFGSRISLVFRRHSVSGLMPLCGSDKQNLPSSSLC